MINLIPDQAKQDIRYAMRNTRLIRYTWISFSMAIAISLVTALSIFSMQSTKNGLNNELEAQNQQLAGLKDVEQKGQKLYDQIETIDQLLNRQVKFSGILPDIAKLLPSGAVLKQLDFSSSDLTGEASSVAGAKPVAPGTEKPFVISAAVTDRTIATTLVENIKAKKDLFSTADLIDVSQNGDSTSSSSDNNENAQSAKYPYLVTIHAYFKKPGGKP